MINTYNKKRTVEVTSVIEEYKKSDYEKRLLLFLGHRLLRKEFINIEQNYPAIIEKREVYN